MTALATASGSVIIGPADHGRRMTLEEFDRAEGEPGFVYELDKGVIDVMQVPNPRHLQQVFEIRRQLGRWHERNPHRIHLVAGGGECKLLLADIESERHPDLAVYRTPPPSAGSDVWGLWIPTVVIEIVSPDSRRRDYDDKRDEYFRFGVVEYWIVDADRSEMTVLRRERGKFTETLARPPQPFSTPHLPGFELDLAAVFASAT